MTIDIPTAGRRGIWRVVGGAALLAAFVAAIVPASGGLALTDVARSTTSVGLIAAQAQDPTNVVPNGDFERGGCGSTPVICGWASSGVLAQDTTNAHSGNASLSLDCGSNGCYGGGLPASVSASTGAASCTAIGPDTFRASFWYRTAADEVGLRISFFEAPDCTGEAWVQGFTIGAAHDGAWHQASGGTYAPPGTQSVLFSVSVGTTYPCDDYCSLWASCDDLVVTGVVTGTVPPVVDNPPSWPIADVITGPPPIPDNLPAAGATPPPAQLIADPITPNASCSGWRLQTRYGDHFVTASTWWEYQCTQVIEYYVDPPCWDYWCDGMLCSYPISCYSQREEWTDHFYWDGSNTRFSGQIYSVLHHDGSYQYTFKSEGYWWDAPTARWYGTTVRPLLTVGNGGSSSGHVTSSPAAINCGDTCQTRFDKGTVVTLTATPDPSFVFAGWGWDCPGTGPCQVTMDHARTINAYFGPDVQHLTVSKDGPGNGTVSSNPPGIDCATTCEANFATGTSVTLTATPDQSSLFVGWSGSCMGAGPCQLTMDGPRWVRPTFTTNPPPPPNTPPSASFTVNCTAFTCHFDGSASTDSDGTITSYSWNFGDTYGEGRATPAIEHTYYQAGTYHVTLQLTDNRGAQTTSAPKVVTLTNIAPTATFTHACTGLTCSFDGRGSSDSDGTITNWWWDFGDGGPALGGSSTSNHTYTTAGAYTVQLQVMDDGHLFATHSHVLSVTDTEPSTSTTTSTTVPPPSTSTTSASTTSTTTSTSTTTTTSLAPALTAPDAPRAVSAEAVGATAVVQFSPPLSNGGSPITLYTARCSSSNGGATRQTQQSASPINVPSLSHGKTYTCTVQATNAIGTGPASAPTTPFRIPK